MIIFNPESVGVSSHRLTRIQPVMQQYIDEGKFPGLLTLIARRGKLVHLGCYGRMDVEANKPMQPDTIFSIASMTKPITCVATMMLYEEGHFQLNDPISAYMPEFANQKVFVKATEDNYNLVEPARAITIRDLFTHTSGLISPQPADGALATLYEETNLDNERLTLREIVMKLAQLPLAFQPGTVWRYGPSHDVLAYLVEIISGLPFDVFLSQRIFEPLGMVDTGFGVPESKAHRYAGAYNRLEDGKFELHESPADSIKLKPNPPVSGSGRLVSTAFDYLCFTQMMLNGGDFNRERLLSRKSVELMTTNHLSADVLPSFDVVRLSRGYYTKGYGYGLGVRVLLDLTANEILGSVGSYGWAGVANTYYWADPQEQVIGFIWSQISQLYYYPIERQFMALTYQALTA